MLAKFVILAAGALLAAAPMGNAQFLKNGDFEKGHSYWEGGGKVVFLNDAGEVVPSAKEGKPALEVKLSRTQLTEIRQRFLFAHGERHLNVSALVKTSGDFQRNNDAGRWTKDITWTSGWYSWSALVYPRVDFCVRVDTSGNHFYLPRNLKAGGTWQTFKGSFKDMPSPGGKVLTLVFPAGTGTLWVKSITSEAK